MRAPELPSWTDLARPAAQLGSLVFGGRCARVGEAAAVSTFVHTFDPLSPDTIGVVTGADAGRVFYHRHNSGEIVHIDVFHEVGEVDHSSTASWLLRALALAPSGEQVMDLVDVQTGTGGGRITGSLKYGLKPSLRRAHMNHVHVTARLDTSLAHLIMWLVAGAECAVIECGKQIRRIKHLALQDAGQGAPADLSSYSTPTDSQLREDRPGRLIDEQRLLQSAIEMADELGGIDEMSRTLEEIASWSGSRASGPMKKERLPLWPEQVERLINKGLVKREGRNLALTESGWDMRDFLTLKNREIEMQFRRLLRRSPRIKPPKERQNYASGVSKKPGRSWGSRPIPLEKGEWAADLAITETVAAALSRCPYELSISPEDLRTYRERGKESTDVWLLIDASASMAGKRIRAAKFLAQHLLLAGKDKVSVVVFQEGLVKVEVPFTRNFGLVQAGLARIQPMGLTPLAEGLVKAAEYVKQSKVRRPLLLLVTDGIPTVPKWTLNPLEDSLLAASKMTAAGVRFGCIGLQPNKSFLQSLCRRARGTLYIVDELEREALANIAHRERQR